MKNEEKISNQQFENELFNQDTRNDNNNNNTNNQKTFRGEENDKKESYQFNSSISYSSELNNKRLNQLELSGGKHISQNNSNNDHHEDPNTDIKLMSKEEIKNYSHLIFLSMAKFSPKENDYFISQYFLTKIMKENSIISDKLTAFNQFDTIFKSLSPKSTKLNSEQFLTFLIKLAQRLYPKEFNNNPKETMNFFMQRIFENYADILNGEKIPIEAIGDSLCQFKTMEALITYSPDNKQKYLINKILYTINEIYIKYFVFELNYSPGKSANNLLQFTRDFEILPYIITETQLVTYYHLSINMNDTNPNIINKKKNKGVDFTLNNFCIFIIHFSLLSYQKRTQNSYNNNNNNKILSDVSKLFMFLEKLEISKGMKTLAIKIFKPKSNKLSFIPPKEVYFELGELSENKAFSFSKEKNSKKSHSSNKVNESKSKYNNISLINSNIDGLERTFLFFARIGDKMNFEYMNIGNYMRFLKHCSLLNELPLMYKKGFYSISQKIFKKENSKNFKKKGRSNTQSVPFNKNENLSEKEIQYKKTLSQVVNSSTSHEFSPNKNSNLKWSNKLGVCDVNVIFGILTGPRNFDYSQYVKFQINKNSGTCDDIGIFPKSKNTFIHHGKVNKMLKMNFQKFIKSFELISQRLYPNIDEEEAVNKLLSENIIPNLLPENGKDKNEAISSSNHEDNNNNVIMHNNVYYSNIEAIYEKICQNEIKLFLQKLSKYIKIYYQYYCHKKNAMFEFMDMVEFYKNFDIFPELISLFQLKNIFSFLLIIKNMRDKENNRNSSININDNIDEKFSITFREFLFSLGIIGLMFDFDENFSDIEKLIYLVERMNQSEGIKKCHLELGRTYSKAKDLISFLLEIKKEYPNFYQFNNREDFKVAIKQKNQRAVSIDDIYGESEEENKEQNE